MFNIRNVPGSQKDQAVLVLLSHQQHPNNHIEVTILSNG